MRKTDNAYSVRLSSMKLGSHEFDFKLDKTFFEVIDQSLIEDGEVLVKLKWERKDTMMVAFFELKGVVFTSCDRCNDPISVSIDSQYKLVYKFGTEDSDDENLIVLHPETIEIDMTDQLYEFSVVSLPNRVIHPAGECNEEMMKYYETFIVNANEPEPTDEEDWDDDEDWDEEDEQWLRDQLGDDDEEEDEDGDDEDSNDDIDPNKPIDPRWAALQQLKK